MNDPHEHDNGSLEGMLVNLDKEAPDVRFTYRVDHYNYLEDCLFVDYIPGHPELDSELLRVKPGETDEETIDNILAMAPIENWALELSNRKRKSCCSAHRMVGREGKGRKHTCKNARHRVMLTQQQMADLDYVRDVHITELKAMGDHVRKSGFPFAFEDGVHKVSADDKSLAFVSSLLQEKGGPDTIEYRVADNTQHPIKKSKIPELLGAILRFRDRTLKYQWAREADIRAAKTPEDVAKVPLADIEGR